MPWSNNNKNMSTLQAFSIISNMLQGGAPGAQFNQYAMGGAGFNPAYANPNPAMYQQPAPGPMGTPQQGPTNGFGFVGAGPMGGYQAQTQGYQTVYGQPPVVDPNMQPQPAPAPVNQQPAAPDAATATTDGSTKTVAASFKA